jgi:hypothetical protein
MADQDPVEETMNSMAEQWFHNGSSEEFFVNIILAPNAIMLLFIDGSSIVESSRYITIYESCWFGV